jgi:hypothetical protein
MHPVTAQQDALALTARGSPQAGPTAHRFSTVTPGEKARRAQAIDEALEEIEAIPDDDPAAAAGEAMRELGAHRAHGTLFEGIH